VGYRLTNDLCATLETRRNEGGAGDATPIHFAPLRHLRHPLIGEGRVEQRRTTASSARISPHSGGTTSGWRLRLAEHGARLLTTARIDR
jgi:hypothetical protein